MHKELDYAALGERIRMARHAKSLTQEKLGAACGLSAAHIGHIERGTRIPSIDTLYKIACELNVSSDYLLFDSAASGENLFESISSIIKDKNAEKIKRFMAAVKALADKIDDL